MEISCAESIKERVKELGVDLCGIASVERFSDAPLGFHPVDIMKECKSVIVMALHFPLSTLHASSQAAYTFVRNQLAGRMDSISFQIAVEMENKGGSAVPIPSSEPYEYWDESRRHGQGILSLKHAAVRAGLGTMGKNTLLLNEQFGNMLWLGAVLIDQEIAADKMVVNQACISKCRICLDSCPAKALDGVTIIQSKCRAISAKYTEGGEGVYACNLCRKVCPQYQGIN